MFIDVENMRSSVLLLIYLFFTLTACSSNNYVTPNNQSKNIVNNEVNNTDTQILQSDVEYYEEKSTLTNEIDLLEFFYCVNGSMFIYDEAIT